MGQGATFFRLRYVVYCPSLGSSARPVFMHGLSQIACMVRPSIEQGIQGRSVPEHARIFRIRRYAMAINKIPDAIVATVLSPETLGVYQLEFSEGWVAR